MRWWPSKPNFPIELTSPLSPYQVCDRLLVATGQNAPAFVARPQLQRDQWSLMFADEHEFRFRYLWNRTYFDVLGKIEPADVGSRIAISIYGDNWTDYLLPAVVGLTALAVKSALPLLLLIPLFLIIFVIRATGLRNVAQRIDQLATVVEGKQQTRGQGSGRAERE